MSVLAELEKWGLPPHVDADFVARTVDRLLGAREALLARSAAARAAALGRAGERFLVEGDEIRAEALRLMPGNARLSPEMTRVVLDGMAADWTAPRLLGLLEAEFGDGVGLDHLSGRGDRSVMAVGPALCTQIVAGSVPGVGVTAAIRSLLVGAPTLLKPGAGDVVTPVLFLRALRETDAALAEALAVVYWPGGAGAGGEAGGGGEVGLGGEVGAGGEGGVAGAVGRVATVEEAALARAEVVVVYGSDETVAAVRARVPAAARFIGYRHRFGVAVVGRPGLSGEAARSAAEGLARAVALFERRGCVCPQVAYVEEGGSVDAAGFAEFLAKALATLETELPGTLDTGDAASLQQLRGTAEIRAGVAGGSIAHGGAASWTVIHEPEPAPGPDAPGRVIRVRPIPDVDDLAGVLGPSGAHLQTVGYAGLEPKRAAQLAERLGRVGASRIVPLDRVSFPPPWWMHDGREPLRDLVRWVELE